MLAKENIWKIAAALYVAGFVVHNVFLAQFGNYEFDLIQARYVLVGTTFTLFLSLCFLYLAVGVNLSYVPDSLKRQELFPWLLRAGSLPCLLFVTLYPNDFADIRDADVTTRILAATIVPYGVLIVGFSMHDIVFQMSRGNRIEARVARAILRYSAIPFLIGSFAFALKNSEFRNLFFFVFLIFSLFLGQAFSQADERHGIEVNYLDDRADEKHESYFKIVSGLFGIVFVSYPLVTSYVAHIYPKIPVAVGGAKLETASIHTGSESFDVEIIQESNDWILYKRSDTESIEKMKTEKVARIRYSDSEDPAPGSNVP